MTIIYFILILGIIIFVHELGHFIFAKLFGVYVYEFALGMGPKIWSKQGKDKETTYSLRAIPIGGFCQLAGEEVDDDSDIPNDRKLQAKKPWQRFLIMFFGAGMNFILAFLIILFSAVIWGAPNMDPVVGNLTPGYPMVEAGIETGDKIISINGKKTSTIDDVRLYFALSNPEKGITFEMKKKNGSEATYEVKPIVELKDGDKASKTYKYGIEFAATKDKGIFAPIKYAFVKTGALFKQMVITLQALFTGVVGPDNLAGPVGIYSIVGQTQKAGFESVFALIALLSINVGFLNLMPFPAFDGGRILFIVIEKIKGSPVKAKTENLFHMVGFILLMVLLVYITFNDIVRMFFS